MIPAKDKNEIKYFLCCCFVGCCEMQFIKFLSTLARVEFNNDGIKFDHGPMDKIKLDRQKNSFSYEKVNKDIFDVKIALNKEENLMYLYIHRLSFYVHTYSS